MLRYLLPLVLIATSTLAQVPILLNGNTFDGAGGALLSGRVYHIISTGASCGITVPGGQTLTIQAGTVIKVGGCWSISGNVQAIGTANAPIFITSIHDDARGGDTNNNGTMTAPQRGAWSAIDCLGDGSRFEHCHFLFGGRNASPNFACAAACSPSGTAGSRPVAVRD